jgi:hypothetical protein
MDILNVVTRFQIREIVTAAGNLTVMNKAWSIFVAKIQHIRGLVVAVCLQKLNVISTSHLKLTEKILDNYEYIVKNFRVSNRGFASYGIYFLQKGVFRRNRLEIQ